MRGGGGGVFNISMKGLICFPLALLGPKKKTSRPEASTLEA